VTFKGKNCTIRNRNDKVIGIIPVSANGLYKVEHAYSAIAAPERVDLPTLHRRLCHIVPDAIRALINKGAAEGVQLINDRAPLLCDSCEHAKTTRKPISKEHMTPLADAFGTEVHTDLWGPSPLQSLGGRKYYIAFTDDATRYMTLTVLRSKDEAFDAYKAYAAWVHTQHGVRIKRLCSDRGGEFTSGEFTKFLKQQGTERMHMACVAATGKLFPSLQTQTTLFCDNQAALKLATEDNYHARTKHIDIRFHFIRQIIASGTIKMVYCPTDDMTADVLTKALLRWKVMCHSLGLGLRQPSGGVVKSEMDRE
jgi:hypothetical protein